MEASDFVCTTWCQMPIPRQFAGVCAIEVTYSEHRVFLVKTRDISRFVANCKSADGEHPIVHSDTI